MADSSRFRTTFNRNAIGDLIAQARETPPGDDPVRQILKSTGLRYVVKASNPSLTPQHIEGMIADFWPVRPEVEVLFASINDLPLPESLQGYFLVSIPGVTFDELAGQHYDLAYILLAQQALGFISVEPDLPFLFFASGTGVAPQAVPPGQDHGWSLRNIRADSAWQLPPPTGGLQRGAGISVAHLDTGWTYHDDLDQGNFDKKWRIKDFIDKGGNAHDPMDYGGLNNAGHGTRTGSVITSRGGVTDTGTTPPGVVTGVAGSSVYVPMRCIKSVIVINNSEIAQAIDHARQTDCDVISMSLGGRGMKALHDAIQAAVSANLLVVCAAGNNVRKVVWPAAYPETLAIAATNYQDAPWAGSCRGREVDVSAPGEQVWHAEPDVRGIATTQGDGTSYATATTAGVAALWLAFFGKQALLEVADECHVNLQELFRNALKTTARAPGAWNPKKYGSGIVDAAALLNRRPTCEDGAMALEQPVMSEMDELVQQVKSSLATELAVQNPQDLDMFNHELANIVLDELSENRGDRFFIAAGTIYDIVARRGSATLRSVLGMYQ